MEDTRYTWNKAFLGSVDFDTWGQVYVTGVLDSNSRISHIRNIGYEIST